MQGPSFPVIDGYDILEELGRGGMGVVYRAYDRRRGSIVALKTMQRVDGAALYRFKQEFRALRDVTHPNLVNLHELVSDSRNWFITMELVDGVDLLRYVRSAPIDNAERTTLADDSPGTTLGETGPELPSTLPATGVSLESTRNWHAGSNPPGGPPTSANPPRSARSMLGPEGRKRLRRVIRQLAEAIAALHDAGKLHRDIKPSNVLVTRDGRVVLMDFGLATERDREGIARSAEGDVVGTVAYMAPEQAAGLPLSPSCDWYSLGVMLYEALTGRLPFLGGAFQVLMDKQRHEPAAPRELATDVPEDLDLLCVDLLRRDPGARPSAREILRRLGSVSTEPGTTTNRPTSQGPDGPLIGRERHRQVLSESFEAVRAGRTVVVSVLGRSGVGKSALVQRFLDELAGRDDAVVLPGRCYENESVPYKALDSLIDALSRYLHRLSDTEVEALLPRDVGPLARVFPVLRRVSAVASAPRRAVAAPDPQELRRRAFAGLRELLARMSDRRPLVLAIDDLQWADADSLAALAEVLRPPDPPILLLIGCYRGEEDGRPPSLFDPNAGTGPRAPSIDRHMLVVDPLDLVEARDLALALLGRADSIEADQAEAIARESGGPGR